MNASVTTRILVVDDEPAAMRFVCRELERRLDGQCEILLTSDATMALRFLSEEGPFDLVISDWILSVFQDAEIWEYHPVVALREGATDTGDNGTSSDVPVVILTNYTFRNIELAPIGKAIVMSKQGNWLEDLETIIRGLH